MERIHRRNSEMLKSIIREQGWPTEKTVSDHAASAAFMVAHHADYDPDFQRLCHGLMLEAAERGGVRLGFLGLPD